MILLDMKYNNIIFFDNHRCGTVPFTIIEIDGQRHHGVKQGMYRRHAGHKVKYGIMISHWFAFYSPNTAKMGNKPVVNFPFLTNKEIWHTRENIIKIMIDFMIAMTPKQERMSDL